MIRAVSTFNLLLYHKFYGLSNGNFTQIFPKTALKFYAICILTFVSQYCIISISNEREVIIMKMFLLGMLAMYLGTFIVTLLVGFFTQICENTFLEHIFMFPLLIIYWIIKIIVVPFLNILDNFKK